MQKKLYVFDTSVLLYDAECLTQFEDNLIVVPLAVIAELDAHKTKNDQVGFNARKALRLIDSLESIGEGESRFVLNDMGGEMVILTTDENCLKQIPDELRTPSLAKDIEIISTAIRAKQRYSGYTVTLVSKDTNLRIIGRQCGIVTEDYRRSRIDNSVNLWKQQEIQVEPDVINSLMIAGIGLVPDEVIREYELTWNECVTLRSGSQSVLARVIKKHNQLQWKPVLKKKNVFGIEAKNREQIFAFDLLMDESIDLVSLAGLAGSGKTVAVLAAGLEQVEQGKYKKLVVLRSLVPVGRDLGILPGGELEKTSPYMKAIFDNLEFLIKGDRNEKAYEHYFERGLIEIEAMALMRGRSISNAYIVIEEAQNNTLAELKMILTRAGEGSKVVLTGDLDQIDVPFLDRESCGIAHIVKKFKDQPIAASVYLTRGERSRLAELTAQIL